MTAWNSPLTVPRLSAAGVIFHGGLVDESSPAAMLIRIRRWVEYGKRKGFPVGAPPIICGRMNGCMICR